MKLLVEAPSVLVVQARIAPEAIAAEQLHVEALARRAAVDVRFVNPLTDPPTSWRKKEVLLGRTKGMIWMGTSAMDHTQNTPEQHQFDDLGLPVMKAALEGDVPVLGICYGGQAMAIAAGGEVARDVSRMETGTAPLSIMPGVEHVLFKDQPATPQIILGHKDSVVALPKGANILARTPRDPHSIWTINENKIATQGHPDETTVEGLKRAIVLTRGSLLGSYEPTYPLVDTPHSDLMVLNFLASCAK